MTNPVGERWDKRYKEQEQYSALSSARPFLVQNEHHLPTTGLVLDAAAGLGNNSSYLISKGLNVVGVDVSYVGIHRAHQRFPSLMAIQADLTQISFPHASFDVIINFYFLERRTYQTFSDWIKPGGLLFFETLTHDMLTLKPDINPDYLLEQGELLNAFQGWEVLIYQEGWQTAHNGHQKAVASLLARCPQKL